ncbi:MAG: hypothetical protein EOP51_19125, partial [Sphingobacteriales bacterium]
ATATGLTASTTYFWWVRSVCSVTDKSVWIAGPAFSTTQVPAVIPYTQNFTSGNDLQLTNGAMANKWVYGSATGNPASSLYISNNGTANAYNVSSTSVVHAFRDIIVPAGSTDATLSFDWKCDGESSFDYLRVWLVPASFNPVAGTQITAGAGRIQIGGNFNQQTSWQNYFNTALNLSSFSAQTMRLVFEWRNDGSIGTQPPAAVDNINLSVITCPSPTAVTFVTSTQTTASLTWTAPSVAPASYDYYYSTTNTPPTGTTTPSGNVTGTTAPLTGLTESTTYYFWVRSNCGTVDGNSFWVGPTTFSTLCGAFDVPFYEGFNSTSPTEICWTVLDVNNDGDTWDMNYTSNPYEGNQSAAINTDFNGTNNDDWLISPQINLTANQRLKFHYRVQSANEPNNFEVKLSTTGTNPASFTTTIVPLATYNNTAYVQSITNLPAITGPVTIAFHIPQGGPDGWRLYIDNFIIEDIPPCAEPTNINASCLSTDGGSVTWTAGSNETSWEVALVTAGSPEPTTGQFVTDNQFITSPLVVGTDYTFYVRAVCNGVDGFSPWVSSSFVVPASSPADAEAFCSGVNSVPVDNVDESSGDEGYGQIDCLGSTPNPVWYYITIDNPGNLAFQLTQNTQFNGNTPVGTGLDVDFAAFGPFTSQLDACSQILITPASTNSTLIACSYSTAAIENFTIPNAQTGQVYSILITNFNGDNGQILLTQTNASVPGAGSTSCNITVDLGANQQVCGTQATITADVDNPGATQVYTYQWFEDGAPITPTVVTTGASSQTIQVSNPGSHIYTVTVTVPAPINAVPITDQVTIVLGPGVDIPAPADVTLCGVGGSAQIDLTTLNSSILGTLLPADYVVEYYTSQSDAIAGTAPISTTTPFTTSSQTIYVRVESVLVPACFDVVPLTFVVGTSSNATIAYNGSPYCSSDLTGAVTFTGTPGGVYTAAATTGGTGTIVIDAAAGVIDIAQSTAGTYTVTYTIAATSSCSEFTTTANVEILDPGTAVVTYDNTTYCGGSGVATATVTGSTGGTFASTAGLIIDPATGEIDLALSTAGATYTITYTPPGTGCIESATATVTIVPTPVADQPVDVTACDSYILPALSANNAYFTATNGGGTALNAGDVITSTQTIYVYTVSPDNSQCTDENTFIVTINATPVVVDIDDVTACNTYTLPVLTSGNYWTATGGTGIMLNAGDVITATQTLFVYVESATTPNCTDEESFTVTIVPTPV